MCSIMRINIIMMKGLKLCIKKIVSPSCRCRLYLFLVQYLPSWSLIRIYVENCILRTGLSAIILDTGKQPPGLHSQFKITKHYKEPMKGKF